MHFVLNCLDSIGFVAAATQSATYGSLCSLSIYYCTFSAQPHPFRRDESACSIMRVIDIRARCGHSVAVVLFHKNAIGTCFRVGDDMVMTCAHVIKDFITRMYLLRKVVYATQYIMQGYILTSMFKTKLSTWIHRLYGYYKSQEVNFDTTCIPFCKIETWDLVTMNETLLHF